MSRKVNFRILEEKFGREISLEDFSKELVKDFGPFILSGFNFLPQTDESIHKDNDSDIRESILCYLLNIIHCFSQDLSVEDLKEAVKVYSNNLEASLQLNKQVHQNKNRINTTENKVLDSYLLSAKQLLSLLDSNMSSEMKMAKVMELNSWTSLLYNLIQQGILPSDESDLLIEVYINETGLVHTTVVIPDLCDGVQVKWHLVKEWELDSLAVYIRERQIIYNKYGQEYRRSLALKNQARYAEAKSIIYRLIKKNEIFPFTSGCYVNLAFILINEKSTKPLSEKRNEIERLLNKALEIKPSNKVAPVGFVYLYLLLKDFQSAYYWISKCRHETSKVELKPIVEKFLETAQMLVISDQNFPQQINSQAGNSLLEQILMTYSENYYIHLSIAKLLAMSERVGVLRAYELLENLINKWPTIPLAYIQISMLCGEGYLERPYEQLTFAQKALKLLDNKNTENIKYKWEAEGHKINAYISLGKYEEALVLTKKRIAKQPNNTDLHNHALVLYYLKRYEESIRYCQRALYIGEDESSYFLLGENYYYLKEYKQALEQYRKSLSFIDEDKRSIHYIDLNKKLLVSYSKQAWFEKKLENIYVPIIDCYFNLDDLVSAKVIWEIANKRFPQNKAFSVWKNIIDKIIDARNERELIQRRNKELLEEFEKEKRKTESQTSALRQWAIELMKIQGDEEEIEDSQWEGFATKIELVISQMLSETKSNLKPDDYLNKIKSTFPKFEPHSIEFLATAEYLFELNKNSFIDFAPIMVEYCKVIELELCVLLGNKKLTLGQSIRVIEDKKIKPLIYQISNLKEIYLYRNGSAHTGKSTRRKIEIVRELLFEKNMLSLINTMKK
ncbi:tetratricopeptide repeat protein [Bacillus marasmi]|uniref:tetratricopeptide repeat protein n=1 Tax=Bacillus marasmi TaxID=1926279 RepID=UPI0011C885F2|nr:tetratricopeptide repeat protein [Bacillus marasmi]